MTMLGVGRAGEDRLGAVVLAEGLTPRGPKMGKVDGIMGRGGCDGMEWMCEVVSNIRLLERFGR